MNIQTRKIFFVQEFLRLTDTKLVGKLEKILQEEKAKEFKTNLKPISKTKFNKMIDESVNDVKKSKVIDARELKKSVKGWR